MARPLKELARDTRRETLDAALELFAQNGFHGTSMREIARAVKVRESALYHHFESKEAILRALMDELGHGRFEEFARVVTSGLGKGGGHGLLRRLAHRLLEGWATPREQKFARLMMAEGLRLGSSSGIHPREVFERARERLAGLFQELLRRKQIRKLDPEVAATEFMGPMMLIRMTQLVLPGAPPELRKLKAMADSHVDFFWRAVKA